MSDTAPVDNEEILRPKRHRGKRWWTFVVAGSLLAAAFLIAWIMRVPIAEDFVERELEKRGVRATYVIDDISFRTQRLRNVVIGDPDNPDLVAPLVEIDLDLLSGGKVTQIRADGARLYGRFVNGKLSLGELDKFSDPDSDEALALPDIDVVVNDARGRFETPWAVVGVRLDGKGNLQDGFKGRMAAITPRIEAFGCQINRTTAYVDLSVSDKKPNVSGPLRMTDMTCDKGRMTVERPEFAVDANFTEELAVKDATFGAVSGPLALRGSRIASVEGKIALSNLPRAVATEFDVKGTGLDTPWVDGRELAIKGRFAAAKIKGVRDPLKFDGDVRLSGARASTAMRSTIAKLDGAGSGTPFGPILSKFSAAAGRAAGNADISAHVDYGRRPDGTRIVVSDLSARSASGARITLDGGEGLFVDPATGQWRLDGELNIAGGDLPQGTVRLRSGASGRVSGEARFAPYRAGNAEVALAPVRFFAAPGGSTRVETILTMTGPFAGGTVEDVTVPIDATIGANGRFAMTSGCVPVRYRRIAISSFSTQPGAVRLCGDGGSIFALGAGGAEGRLKLASPQIVGRIGSSPAKLQAADFRYDIAAQSFAGNDVDVAIGDPEAPVRMRFDTLNGAFGSDGIAGTIAGGSGRIANVPLDLKAVAGDWTFVDGALTVDGAMRVSDIEAGTETGARFEEMIARDVTLVLAGNNVVADGLLIEPASDRRVATLDIEHRLSSGVGRADLVVDNLVFDDRLQPSQLFKSALGVVANVRGSMDGRGQIRWNGSNVESDGVFRTAGMDLAAPFGPVEGITTEVVFTDLLGLVSEPGRATVASVNPGFEVFDGVVDYQLLPDQKIGVRGARWPFVGGALELRPTVLDFSEEKTRNLVFDITGLDAATFIERFEFDNLLVTGTFDGTVPVSFDQEGGRVNGGLLTARPGGGTIRYVGELSNRDLGMMANIAFGALKSIKYDSLTIGLTGRLDGEMVTDIKFEGLGQGDGADRNILTRAIAKIPFEFNIKITAQFRTLLTMARGFYEPELLIEQNLPQLPVRRKEDDEVSPESETSGETGDNTGVQAPESEEMP